MKTQTAADIFGIFSSIEALLALLSIAIFEEFLFAVVLAMVAIMTAILSVSKNIKAQ